MYIISLIIIAEVEFLIKCLKEAKLKFQLASLRSFMRTPIAEVTQAKKKHIGVEQCCHIMANSLW